MARNRIRSDYVSPEMRFVWTVVIFALVAASCAGAENGGSVEVDQIGARIYAENCSVCHEVDGTGRITEDGSRIGRPLTGVAKRYTEAQHVEIVTFGGQIIGGSSMPAWGRLLTAEEIRAVVDFERATFVEVN